MKIILQSFIKKGQEFIVIDEFSGKLNDNDYIDGAIELSVDGVVLFDKNLWDCVDNLWSYILWGLEDLSAGKEHVTGFPDQPIEIHFRPLGDRFAEIEVKYGKGRRVRVELKEFIAEMLVEAEYFFKKMREIALRSGGRDYAGELERIEKIRVSLEL